MIHPTAIIDPSAKLGTDITVGPYCIIGPNVELGDGCWLQHHVTIMGPSKIGPRNKFWAYGSIGQQTQDLKYAGEPTWLEIGSDNEFREFCTVHRATSAGHKTVIGSHNHFLSYVHIAHDCIVGDHVIFSNNGTLAGHVVVEDHVILGGLSAVHQFCRIGKHAFIGGCAKITQDVLPYTVADGNPGRARGLNLVGLRRAGYDDTAIKAINSAYRTLYRKGLNTSQAIEVLHSKAMTDEVASLAEFVEGSQRGIVSAGKAGGD
ncbi:MAG: acyl-ACP--UDP-N-acetylglucosamine O-acyltransferase [Verrucomicrobiaceae bacterium]|nr:acyl-ACP--UDP-N-acetylglucosamine O-acyltransferase [Verrucomicrobiaceae bacterium]